MYRYTLIYSFVLLAFIAPKFVDAQAPAVAEDPSLSILPPSPTAAALAKYAEFPVNYYSGTPQIRIPLHTISGRRVAASISLSYHAGGVKVNDVASSVGLGWSLNAGGVISRTIMGEADEGLDGFMTRGSQVPNSSNVLDNFTELKHFANAADVAPWDGQPDIFNFNFGGYSGRFVFEDENTVRLIPHQDLEITYNKSNFQITDFKVVTPDGMEYTFGTTGAIEKSESSSYAVGASNGCRAKQYGVNVPTAWYLKKVRQPATKDEIIFNYASKTISYDIAYTESYRHPNGIIPNNCGNNTSVTRCVTTKTDDAVYLTSIQGQRGEISFDYTTRNDVIGDNKLSTINIKGKQGDLLKKFQLVYHEETATGTTPSTDTYSKVRLYLEEVEEYGADNIFVNEYKFGYYNRNLLPPRLAYQQDHWGFFNDNTANGMIEADASSIIGLQPFFSSFENADRSPSPEKSKYGILNQVTYPTGGTVQYEYEGNDIPECDFVEEEEEINTGVEANYQNSPVTETADFTISTTQLARINYSVFKIGVMSNSAYVELKRINDGQLIFSRNDYEDSNITPACFDGYEEKELIPGTYRLTAYAAVEDPNLNEQCSLGSPSKENASISVDYFTTISTFRENLPIGGVRVKQITYDDGDADLSNNIIRVLEYREDINNCPRSTGVALGKNPRYRNEEMTIVPEDQGDNPVMCAFSECPYVILTSSSLSTLANHTGSTVGYREVWEKQGLNAENGYTYYKFEPIIDGSSELGPNEYNYFLSTPTIDYSYKSGKLIEQKVYNKDEQIMSSQINEYELDESVNETQIQAIFARQLFQLPCPSGTPSEEIQEYAIEWYKVVSQWVYLKKTTDRVYASDGSGSYTETVSNYSYDLPDGRFTMPTAISMTNSDGKVTENSFLYAHDKSGSEYTAMLNQNIIATPVEVIKKVGGTQIDGTRTDYTVLDGYPYPTAAHRYEVTWNDDVLTVTGSGNGWEKKWEVNTYDTNLGLPTQFTREGWDDSEFYTWTSEGYLQTKQFINFTESFEYYPDKPLISRKIDIDGQYVDFNYDNSLRLQHALARPKTYNATRPNEPMPSDYHTSTTTTYHYHTGTGDPINYTETIAQYTPINGSGLTNHTTRQYMDGLGRPIQTVRTAHSPTGKDVVVVQEYDEHGRLIKVSEPFESPLANNNSGNFVPSNQHPSTLKYTFTEYEDSPLNRATKITPPDWHKTITTYGANTTGDAVSNLQGTGTYAENELMKVVVADPNGNKTATFKDKKGRLILSRRLSADESEMSDTYYIYDDKDRVTTVIPPDASSSDANLIYTYEYDGEDKVTQKKIPGSEVINMRYNSRDLVTATQDGLLRANPDHEWLVTQYDTYGRAIKTGFTASEPANLDMFNIGAQKTLTETIYDGDANATADIYTGKVRKTRIRVLDGFDPAADNFDANLDNWLETTLTYDNYGRVTSSTGNNHLKGTESITSTYDYADNMTQSNRDHSGHKNIDINENYHYDLKGRQTDIFHRITHQGLATPQEQVCNLVYDHEDQITARSMGGFNNGADFLQTCDYLYNEQGWLTQINQEYLKPTIDNESISSSEDLFYLKLSYDEGLPFFNFPPPTAQRNGNIAAVQFQTKGKSVQAYRFEYDYLDRLSNARYAEKQSGVLNYTGTYDTNYTYADARGNISSIRRKGEYFKFDPITDFAWESDTIDDLSFTYIAGTNQISTVTDNGIYEGQPGVGCTSTLGITSTAVIDNDRFYAVTNTITAATANIDGSKQLRMQAGEEVILESGFDFNSEEEGQFIASNSDDCVSRGIGFAATSTTYTYNVNGNLTKDTGKDIDSILYNHLNLPYQVIFATGDTIEWLYDAAGMKLRKTVKESTTTRYTQDYMGGIEYRNSEVEAIYHAEGRATLEAGGTFLYEYTLKDHLGNSRVTFADRNGDHSIETNEILQESHYYPFGMNIDRLSETYSREQNNYLYNGKELNNDFGLGWMDYGARFYDAQIGRWNGVDLLAEKFNNLTPYHYVTNNPISVIDPNGMDTLTVHRGELNTELSDDATNVWNVTFSLTVNGVVTPIELEEGVSEIYMFGNKVSDENGDNALEGETSYVLKFQKMASNDYKNTVLVGEEEEEVFIHKGNTYDDFAGCKGVCKEYTSEYDDYQESDVFYGQNTQGTLNLIRKLYNKHESNLTGDKFILKPNSTASNDAFMNQLKRHYKSVGVPISLPD